jgi:hypothetical protein
MDMKPISIVLSLSLVACCGSVATSKAPTASQFIDGLDDASVSLVKWKDVEGNDTFFPRKGATVSATCGGVWIAHDYFVTAYHCVASMGKLKGWDDLVEAGFARAWDPLGQPAYYTVKGDAHRDGSGQMTHSYRRGVVSATAPSEDVALVKALDPARHAVASLALLPPHDGEELHVVGDTLGLWFSYSRCYVASAQREDVEAPFGTVGEMLQVSGPVWFGNSGGAAFDGNGDVVGIVSFVYPSAPGTSFFVTARTIRRFMQQHGLAPAR